MLLLNSIFLKLLMNESRYEKALKRGFRSDLLQRDLCCLGIKLRILQFFKELFLFLTVISRCGKALRNVFRSESL